MTEQTTGMSFSRRNFIKGSGRADGHRRARRLRPRQGDAGGNGRGDGRGSGDEDLLGACRAQCGQGCYLNVHVRDGRVVRTTAGHFDDGPEFDRICPKGLVQPARVYSAERLQYPMRRVGERGSG